jgi:hypothetical protein
MLMNPARQEAREKFREPHDQPRGADDGHAPEHGEVIELLPIRPAVELRLRAFAEEPFVVRGQIPVKSCIVGTIESGPNKTETAV